jgi:hypothetical protein
MSILWHAADHAGDPPSPPAEPDVLGDYGAAVTCASAVILLFAIATIDKLTGSELRLQLLYLIPVGIVTWSAGRAWGMAMSCLAIGVWFATNRDYVESVSHHWEAAVSLATLLVFVVLLARLHGRNGSWWKP